MKETIKGYLFIIGATVLFGTTGTAQMLGASQLDPWVVGAFRLIIGGPVLMAASLLSASRARTITAPPLYSLVFTAALGVVLFQFTFFEAVARTGVATGTLVSIGSGPVIAGLLGAVFFKEALDRPWALATLLAVSGCALLVTSGKNVEMNAEGMGFALAAGAGYAVYVVAGRGLTRTMAPSRAMALILCLGAAMMIPFLGTSDLGPLTDKKVILALGYLGIFATALSYFMLTRGLAVVPIASASVLLLVEPLVGSLLGICLLGEALTPGSAAGMALIFSGMAVIALKEFRLSAYSMVK